MTADSLNFNGNLSNSDYISDICDNKDEPPRRLRALRTLTNKTLAEVMMAVRMLPQLPYIVSLSDAKERGYKYYFTNRYCKRGHIALRFVSGKNCSVCARINAANWSAKNAEASKIIKRKWYEENKPLAIARAVEWNKKHPEKRKEHNKSWLVKNLDKNRSRNRAWKLKNRERSNELARRQYRKDLKRSRQMSRVAASRRRYREQLSGSHYTAEDLENLHKMQRGMCAYCGKKLGDKYHADHIVPVSRGGDNSRYNIAISCPPCNLKKHAKMPEEWAFERGQLV